MPPRIFLIGVFVNIYRGKGQKKLNRGNIRSVTASILREPDHIFLRHISYYLYMLQPIDQAEALEI